MNLWFHNIPPLVSSIHSHRLILIGIDYHTTKRGVNMKLKEHKKDTFVT